MGLIKAAVSAVSGNLADQWLEAIEADNMTETVLMAPGVAVNRRKGANTKGNSNVISNGSKIHVYPNQMMLIVENGRIIDYCAEEGCYTVDNSSSPSLFNGQFKDALKETFERFKFGGVPSQSQHVYFINLSEIPGIKYGTKNAIQYYDKFYDAELFIRCHGVYSIRITDPIKFFIEVQNARATRFDAATMNSQYMEEFLMALSAAVNKLSTEGQRISELPSCSFKLCDQLNSCLDESWRSRKGFEIEHVTMSFSYEKESQDIVTMRSKGSMMSNPFHREGYVQTAIAQGLQAAGSNTAGASQAFMGMGMGMNAAGGFMNAASQTNAMQMQMQQQQAAAQQSQAVPAAGEWKCSCGHTNTGKFCAECGTKKPEEPAGWKCSCGHINTGKFCSECGAKMPEQSESWQCSCGQVNTGKFCSGCGNPRT